MVADPTHASTPLQKLFSQLSPLSLIYDWMIFDSQETRTTTSGRTPASCSRRTSVTPFICSSYTAAELGATHAWNEAEELIAVDPSRRLFVCLETLSMGGSWSLYFCHVVTARAMCVSLRRLGLTDRQASSQLAIDGRAAPSLGPGLPIAAPYVDNGNGICWDRQDAGPWLACFEAVLTEWGLAYRVECHGAPGWDTIGLSVDLDLR